MFVRATAMKHDDFIGTAGSPRRYHLHSIIIGITAHMIIGITTYMIDRVRSRPWPAPQVLG